MEKIKSNWYVLFNPMAGYIAARTKDISEPVHSGNLEFSGEYSDDKSSVQELVSKLNEDEKKSKE